MPTANSYEFLDDIAKVIEPMYTESQEKSAKHSTPTSKEFIKELDEFMEPMMEISRRVARKYFIDERPSNEDYVRHFKLKMFNERINMVEIADKVSKLNIAEDPVQCVLLAKQVLDEANHFRLVKEVVEYYNGGPIDVAQEQTRYGQAEPAKGAYLIEKYKAKNDPLVLAAYQYLVEGRAATLWSYMGEIVPDDFVARRYAKIGRDERFHQNIGRIELERLCTTKEAQDRVRNMLPDIIWDLWDVTCLSNTLPSEDIKSYMMESYGQPNRELAVPLH
jgi:hypothetical protein